MAAIGSIQATLVGFALSFVATPLDIAGDDACGLLVGRGCLLGVPSEKALP